MPFSSSLQSLQKPHLWRRAHPDSSFQNANPPACTKKSVHIHIFSNLLTIMPLSMKNRSTIKTFFVSPLFTNLWPPSEHTTLRMMVAMCVVDDFWNLDYLVHSCPVISSDKRWCLWSDDLGFGAYVIKEGVHCWDMSRKEPLPSHKIHISMGPNSVVLTSEKQELCDHVDNVQRNLTSALISLAWAQHQYQLHFVFQLDSFMTKCNF